MEGTVPRLVFALTLLLLLAACSNSNSTSNDQTTVVRDSQPTEPTPAPTDRFPTAETTGVPPGRSLSTWSGPLRTSEADQQPTETVRGLSCKVFEDIDFDFGTTGGYLYVDDPCVLFRSDRFTTSAAVSNTGAMVQQAQENHLLVVERSDFDGGTHHQRGVQGDYADIVVHDSRFTRFGNAAVEMNNREGTASFEMQRNYLYETGGWAPDDHVDGFQVGAGGRIDILFNTVLVTPFGGKAGDFDYVSNSALGLWAEAGNVTGPVNVEGNLLAGGGKLMYLQQKSDFRFEQQVRVVGNTFDRRFTAAGGIWGVLADDGLPSRLDWTDNTWEDGSPVTLVTARADG